MSDQSLGLRLRPCGPVVDAAAAARLFEALVEAAVEQGWFDALTGAWPALEPVFAASPYLAGLARRDPARLSRRLEATPDADLDAILRAARDAGALAPGEARARLRGLKADLHLLTALCDLGGLWELDQVTFALSRFADAAAGAALRVAAAQEVSRGRLDAEAVCADNPAPGLFGLAMGKWGADELNYSSDIDLTLFHDPDLLPVAGGAEPQALANRIAQTLANLLSERTADGYVFRVDLRLRPDPASTPAVNPWSAALNYYESVGQNWERAAFIKARPALGDTRLAERFLEALKPFVWRRSLDFAAIADVHAIRRQIHVRDEDERLEAAGANLKLGAGGIREIEFFAQTEQLVLGGRDPGLRAPRTLDALNALAAAGHVSAPSARVLTEAYQTLRGLEHRAQMLADEQTHTLPRADEERRRVAALAGEGDLARFDRDVSEVLGRVNRVYASLFAQEEPLSTAQGSLVFTGVEDDPETLATLTRMGFQTPQAVSAAIRSWHHGRIGATRSERGRELFTRLAPRLLEACADAGAPDAAFTRFAAFFSGLAAGVQIQSLFLAQPALFRLIVEVLAFSPRLAAVLARTPSTLDAMLDTAFFSPLETTPVDVAALEAETRAAGGFEAAMDAARRLHREQAFRIGAQILTGRTTPMTAGLAWSRLAGACVRALAPVALAETERTAGAFPGAVAVLAMGKLGSEEMTAASDLDLAIVYAVDRPDAASEGKGLAAETFFGRFAQRLIAALSAPTGQGGLYEIDMRLRPTGSKGPVSVGLEGFVRYYRDEAEVWELQALTRARVVWASRPEHGLAASAAIADALRRRRPATEVFAAVGEMRALMERERPATGFWDLKRAPGGIIDAEFAAQALQLVHAGAGGPLLPSTLAALEAYADRLPEQAGSLTALARTWRLSQAASQVMSVAAGADASPDGEPAPFQTRLAQAVGAQDLSTLAATLAQARSQARAAFENLVRTSTD